MARIKKPTFVTPAGEAIYAWIRHPDTEYTTREGVAQYKLTLALDPDTPECQEFTAMIDGWLAKVKAEKAPYKEEDGKIHVKFKSNYAPAVFDAQRNLVPSEVEVGRGSTLRAAFTANHYDSAVAGSGINLRLDGVQVINLVEYQGRSAESMGFDLGEGFAPEPAQSDTDAAGESFDENRGEVPPTDREIAEQNDEEDLPF